MVARHEHHYGHILNLRTHGGGGAEHREHRHKPVQRVPTFPWAIAVAVMIGQSLGANDIALARRQVWKMIFFSACVSVVLGGILALSSNLIPTIYNAGEDVRRIAAEFNPHGRDVHGVQTRWHTAAILPYAPAAAYS